MNVGYHVKLPKLEPEEKMKLKVLASGRRMEINELITRLIRDELDRSKEEIYKYLYGGKIDTAIITTDATGTSSSPTKD